MQKFLIVILSCVCCRVAAQVSNTISATTVSSPTDWEDFTTSHQAFKKSTKANRNKFSCVLNLLKNALADELQNFDYVTEDTSDNDNDNNLLSPVNRYTEEIPCLENNETQLEKPITKAEDDRNAINEHQGMISVKMSALPGQNISEQKNADTNINNADMPNMIPIFRPRSRTKNGRKQKFSNNVSPTTQPSAKTANFVPEKNVQTNMHPIISQNELKCNTADLSSLHTSANSRQTAKTKAISFVPEKIIQTNMSPIPNHLMFNIPCQRAADVLDMSVVAPKEAKYRNKNAKFIADTVKPIPPSHLPTQIHCDDEDETITMLFKPKNISLKQVYGNLLKKITITVLVPYHMSKLGEKQNPVQRS